MNRNSTAGQMYLESRLAEKRKSQAAPRFTAQQQPSSGSGWQAANDGALSVALPPGWTKVHTEDGAPYYWNESTGVTSWEVPGRSYAEDL